tara:strand:+ start:79 stop:261 length:183 start_codon:yes stop_codon:yes gene_type:complete
MSSDKFYDMQVDIRILLQEYFESVNEQAPKNVDWYEDLNYNEGKQLITITLLFENEGHNK